MGTIYNFHLLPKFRKVLRKLDKLCWYAQLICCRAMRNLCVLQLEGNDFSAPQFCTDRKCDFSAASIFCDMTPHKIWMTITLTGLTCNVCTGRAEIPPEGRDWRWTPLYEYFNKQKYSGNCTNFTEEAQQDEKHQAKCPDEWRSKKNKFINNSKIM